MNKLVILDRDGVINQDSDAYVKSLEEWIPITNSAAAIARLSKAGYQVAIATNQSGLARGYFSQQDLDAMHQRMQQLVEAEGGKIDHIAWCPHGPDDACGCRKPLPGLIHQIEAALAVSAKGAWLVGDSIRDLEAGIAAGCQPVLVRTGKGSSSEAKLVGRQLLAATPVYDDLSAWVDELLQGN